MVFVCWSGIQKDVTSVAIKLVDFCFDRRGVQRLIECPIGPVFLQPGLEFWIRVAERLPVANSVGGISGARSIRMERRKMPLWPNNLTRLGRPVSIRIAELLAWV